MLCLGCGHDEAGLGPACSDCGNYVGYVAEGGGYLPQLKNIEVALREGKLQPEEAELRLGRLEEALEILVRYMDETGHGLMSLDLDDAQQGTLGGFLTPVRDGFERLQTVVASLDPAGDWGEEAWNELEAAQVQVIQGQEGMMLLTQTMAGYAVEQGADPATLGQMQPTEVSES